MGISFPIERHGHMLTVKELAQLLAESPKATYGNKIALDNWGGDTAMGIDLHIRATMRVENKNGNCLPEQDGTG
jgi:hypothetical protein